MSINTNYAFSSMFREYDVRGRVNKNELNDESMYRIVRAYAYFLREHGIMRAVVGYDNRKYSLGFANVATTALVEMGIDVINIGLCVTPTVYYAQYLHKCEGAVMITASHNPNGWSGLKMSKGYSRTLEPDDVKKIFIYTGMSISDDYECGTITNVNVWQEYVGAIVSRINMGTRKPRIVLDAGNGSAGLFAYEIFQRLGCITFQLNCDPDMEYPHYFPNPSDVSSRKKMKEMVLHPYIQADVGLSFDGDGDRLGVVDEKGQDIWSDIILAVFSKQLLEKKPNASIIFDVKCSKALQDVIEQNFGIPIMCKTGHSYIKAKLNELNADLAGERSGHIFFGGNEYFGFDDALFSAAKLVEYLSKSDESMSSIISKLPQYITSAEIKAHCADSEKYAVVEEITNRFKAIYPDKVNDINGAKVQFEYGWGLIRASSNLPELVMIFEADTMEHMIQIKNEFYRTLKEYPVVTGDFQNEVEANLESHV